MKSEKLSSVFESRIAAGDFPSAVYLVAERSEIVISDAIGNAVVKPEKIEVTTATIFDLASLTKPLVTGLLCALLIERGEIALDDKISKYLPEIDAPETGEISISSLLTHTSGLTSWMPFYSSQVRRDNVKSSVLGQIIKAGRARRAGNRVEYSDLNFILLGFMVENLFNASLERIARTEIFEPLGLRNTFFNPPSELKKGIAASEKGNVYERSIASELFPEFVFSDTAFRKEIIWGEVHDGNCYFMGGVAGHAGLFSNAEDILAIAKQFLPATTSILEPQTCQLFSSNLTPRLNQARAIAFQLAETPGSTAGEKFSPRSFGHLGFTGTSLWIDPESERIFILLTNRTHARNLPFADMKNIRREFNNIANTLLET